MFKHIYKIIWNERRINLLLVIEYFIIFLVLWFVGEMLFKLAERRLQPKGIDIEHTYRVFLDRKDPIDGASLPKYTKEDQYGFATTIEERLRRYPGVEAVGFSNRLAPYYLYGQNWANYRDRDRNQSDTLWLEYADGEANRGYFDVFRVDVQGNLADWDEALAGRRAILTADKEGMIGDRRAADVRMLLRRGRETEIPGQYHILGYTSPIRLIDLNDPYNLLFLPMAYRDIVLDNAEISIRVSPEADRNFAEKFTREMSEQLQVGDFYLSDILSYKDLRDGLYLRVGVTGIQNKSLSIVLFLLLNIFLGILGSFWYRTQTRRSEIGLRLALGSSKVKVKRLMIRESLSLLVTGAIPAAVICYLLSRSGKLLQIGLNMAPRMREVKDEATGEMLREINWGIMGIDAIDLAIAFGTLALITIIAVWYPAKQASDTQPAETLHEE